MFVVEGAEPGLKMRVPLLLMSACNFSLNRGQPL